MTKFPIHTQKVQLSAPLDDASIFPASVAEKGAYKTNNPRTSGPLNAASSGSEVITGMCERLSVVDAPSAQDVCSRTRQITEPRRTFENVHTPFRTPIDAFVADEEGDTALHVAIVCGRADLALAIINMAPFSCCLSMPNVLFQTPLHLAVVTRQPEVVRGLVTSGACLYSQDSLGNTPLHIASKDGLTEIVRILTEHFSQIQSNTGRPHEILDLRNYEGFTCLHVATYCGHVDIVQMLATAGAAVNVGERKTGRTALHIACLSGNIHLVRVYLTCRTCDFNARAYDGLTPFDLARARGHEEACTALAAHGARTGDDDTDDMW